LGHAAPRAPGWPVPRRRAPLPAARDPQTRAHWLPIRPHGTGPPSRQHQRIAGWQRNTRGSTPNGSVRGSDRALSARQSRIAVASCRRVDSQLSDIMTSKTAVSGGGGGCLHHALRRHAGVAWLLRRLSRMLGGRAAERVLLRGRCPYRGAGAGGLGRVWLGLVRGLHRLTPRSVGRLPGRRTRWSGRR
jgi:hypothetical protein